MESELERGVEEWAASGEGRRSMFAARVAASEENCVHVAVSAAGNAGNVFGLLLTADEEGICVRGARRKG
jgi:hypothetical protein